MLKTGILLLALAGLPALAEEGKAPAAASQKAGEKASENTHADTNAMADEAGRTNTPGSAANKAVGGSHSTAPKPVKKARKARTATSTATESHTAP